MRQYSLSKIHPQTTPLYLAIGALLSTLVAMPVAQAASCKLPKSYYKNVDCTANSRYFLATKDFGAPVALIDSSGKKVVDLSRYQRVDADKISGGLIPVQRYSRVGYLNMRGEEVIPVMYDRLDESSNKGWARPVSEGRIVVKRDGNYGVINTANNTIVPFSAAISDIDNYRGGVARVRKSDATSWVDRNGKATSNPNDEPKTASTSKRVQPTNSSAKSSPSRKPLSTSFTTLQPHQQDGKWGFVDDKNVTMITYSFDDVRPFSEGLAGVRVGKDWGFVNLGGELIIPFRFSNSTATRSDTHKGVSAFIFKDGVAWVGNTSKGKKRCIDKKGEQVSCS